MKCNRYYPMVLIYATLAFLLGASAAWTTENGKIVHDAEYYILEAQNGEKWATEDKEIDKRLI